MKVAKLFWLFIFGSMIGFLIENGYRFLMNGEFVRHIGVIVGPFLPIYGIGACVFALTLRKVRSSLRLFLLGGLFGGLTEYFSSLFKDLFLGIKLRDYDHHPFNLSGRTSFIYLFFWGVLCILLIKRLYPLLSEIIEKIGFVQMKKVTGVCFLLFALNLAVSGFALQRWKERQSGEFAKKSI